MYSIENNYYPMIEAVLAAKEARQHTRYHAAMAWWLGRQQIHNENNFWHKVAGKITASLSDSERDAIVSQLKKNEESFVDPDAEWPSTTSSLQSIIDGWSPAPVEVDIEAARQAALIAVDKSAEQYRLNFITGGSGQTMAYQQKLEEARAKLANNSIANSAIPHIVTEASVDGMTAKEKAEQIVATFEQWQQVSAAIEGKRMTAKKVIKEAETLDEITQAANVAWSD